MRVLIAVDDSPESRQAVALASRWFGDDAEYGIISVGEQSPMFVGGYGTGAMATVTDLERQLDAARSAAEHAASGAAEVLDGVVQTEVEVGHPGTVICEYAAEHASDVIVIGSHERSFWERIIDPSVGKHLIDHAPCPVLVVR